LGEEVELMMNQSGYISIAKLSQDYDFSGEFLLEHLEGRINAMVNPQKNGFYTEAYIRRLESRVRGFLSATMVPLPLKPLYKKTAQLDENLVQKIDAVFLEGTKLLYKI